VRERERRKKCSDITMDSEKTEARNNSADKGEQKFIPTDLPLQNFHLKLESGSWKPVQPGS
jgi:hypothetical protein